MSKIKIDDVIKNKKEIRRITIQTRIEKSIYTALKQIAVVESSTISKLLDEILLENNEIKSIVKSLNKREKNSIKAIKRELKPKIKEFYGKKH